MKSVAAMMLMLVVVATPTFAQLAREDSNDGAAGGSRVDGDPPSRDEVHYPLDRSGGIAVPSADLEPYLALLEERAIARAFLLEFPDLLFAAGSTRIDVSVQGELTRMAAFLRTHPGTTARIIGYTDDRGDTLSNISLAEQRAAAVRSYLIDLGIAADRLFMASRGEASPKRDNRSTEGRDSNRRVQIFVQKPVTR
jgi:outer membrane protein OmpA-like peptidoglycan-associated protein